MRVTLSSRVRDKLVGVFPVCLAKASEPSLSARQGLCSFSHRQVSLLPRIDFSMSGHEFLLTSTILRVGNGATLGCSRNLQVFFDDLHTHPTPPPSRGGPQISSSRSTRAGG